jgi:hypothetical protein
MLVPTTAPIRCNVKRPTHLESLKAEPESLLLGGQNRFIERNHVFNVHWGPLPLLSVQAMLVDQELEPLEIRPVNAPLGKVIRVYLLTLRTSLLALPSILVFVTIS